MKHNYVPDGCFLLARQIFESAIWRDDPHVLKLFIYLMGQARHNIKPKKYPSFEIKRGELVTSLAKISEENEYSQNGTIKSWPRMKISRMFDLLEKQGYIKKLCDTYGTHISICNYNTYQDINNYKGDSVVTQVGSKCDTSGKQVGINKKGNKGKNEKNEKDLVGEIIGYLNKVCNKKYKSTTDSTKSFINARLDDGYTVEDLKRVVDVKAKQWKGDDKNDKYLRPETLFNKTKFEGYINEIMPKGEPLYTMPGVDGGMVDLYSMEEVELHKALLAKAANERSGPNGR